jgi:hypothetical protein
MNNFIHKPETKYSQRIELTYSECGASVTDITSFLGSGVLILA